MKKRISGILFFLAVCLFSLTVPTKAWAADAVFTDNGDGTVKVSYDNSYKEKVKLVVQKEGGKQYKYDVPKGKSELTLPLTQGNGTYKLILCRNTTGSKYSIMQTKSVELKLDEEREAYLTSHYVISWEDTNDAIKKAQSLTKKSKTPKAKLQAIYKYIVANYSYDYDKAKDIDSLSDDMAYVPDIDEIFDAETGICYDISVLMASMLRSVEIPAQVVTGYTPNATTYHAWNNVYYDSQSKWKVIDATYDMQMYQAGKKYTMFKSASDYSDIVYTY